MWIKLFIVIAAFAQVKEAWAQYPNVTLPWGTYQATHYDASGDFYIFENIRFGKAPVGNLRFQRSVFPDAIANPSILQPNNGSSCYQATPPACNKTPPDCSGWYGQANVTTSAPPRLHPGLPKDSAAPQSEDCLFADVYVPRAALNRTSVKPIVVWLYGGGFIFGSKDAGSAWDMPFYNATGLLRTARKMNNDFILITGNYRLGAFGWLAGPTMEQYGTPNAGIWDQRLLLDFAQRYLPLFGGNARNISLWGESAGAGSIVQHLVSTQPPVFSTALMQSPAYLWQWDRTPQGYAAGIFNNMTTRAGCPSTGAAAFYCLQSLNASVLQNINEAVVTTEVANTGLIPFNPAVDGRLITQLPTTSFLRGAFWRNVTSFIVSHVADESQSFVPCYITDDSGFEKFLNYFLPGPRYERERAQISSQYYYYSNSWCRAHDVIADSSFLCNTRAVYNAYNQGSNMFMMQYDFLADLGAAVHASDLLPTFYNSNLTAETFYEYYHETVNPNKPEWEVNEFFYRLQKLAPGYQPYLAAFGSTGRPRPGSSSDPNWGVAQSGDQLGNVMEVGLGYYSDFTNDTTDSLNSNSTCNFWSQIALLVQSSFEDDGEMEEIFKSDL